jgi:hypothetical protein
VLVDFDQLTDFFLLPHFGNIKFGEVQQAAFTRELKFDTFRPDARVYGIFSTSMLTFDWSVFDVFHATALAELQRK